MKITLTENDREDIVYDFERTKKYLIHELRVLEYVNDNWRVACNFINQLPDRIKLVIDQIFMPLDELEHNVEDVFDLPITTKKFVLKRKEYLKMVVGELNELSEDYSSVGDTFQRDVRSTLKGLTRKLKSEINIKIF